ncbi:MAG TPA: hypothetical protein VJS91_12105 [Nitrososphaeraceae archaeon]|jgi:hypothetical protein|nr:hypothetical protein [Nitrososphaeraceae archaeon]
MSSHEKDEFGVVKIFSDSQNPKFVTFDIGNWGENSGDREHLARLRYTSTKDGKPTTEKNSVVSTRWTKIGQEFVDQEVTGYFYLSEMESEKEKDEDVAFKKCGKGSSLTIKLRGGKHPKPKDDPDSAKCYNFDFQYKGGDCNNFQKEYPHPDYYKMSVDTIFELKDNMSKWVGYKAVTINQEDGGVRCLAFVDYGSEDREKNDGPDLENQKWKLYFDVTDDGELHKKYKIKSPKGKNYPDEKEVSDPYKTHFKDKVTQFRMDRIVQPEAKFLSVRSISTSTIDDILKNI